MPIKFKCPLCATILNVPDAIAGKTGKCKGCGGKIVVPASSDPVRAPLPSEAPPASAASSQVPRSRSATTPPSPVAPPQRTRPTNPAPASVSTRAPAATRLDAYGALFARVEAATAGLDEGVFNAEVIDSSSPFDFQTGNRGTAAQSMQGSPFVNASGARGVQEKKSPQKLIGFGAAGLLCLFISIALLVIGPEYPPVPVDLAALEAGTKPTKEYVDLGPHIACYYAGVYTMKKRDENKTNPPIEDFSYPVISVTHPAAAELLALVEAHGSFENLPEDAYIPALENVAAVVTTEEFKRTSTIPLVPVRVERLTGTRNSSIPHKRKIEEGCGLEYGGIDNAFGIKANNKPMFRSTGTIVGGIVFGIVSLVLLGLSGIAGYQMISSGKPRRPGVSEQFESFG